MCDTQLGMGDFEHDVKSFKQAVKQINQLNPDFVVICGDLVHNAKDSSFNEFKSILKGLKMSSYLAPGNHDVENIPTNKSLNYYRNIIGKDYFVFQNRSVSFVVVNTQLWKVNIEKESQKHHDWFKKTLDSLSFTKTQIFVIGHYPIFLKTPEEQEAYFNIPKQRRKQVLELFKRHNVKAYLSGHTHKALFNNYKNTKLVSGETTSKNFDKRRLGFRLWEVFKDSSNHKFIPLKEF
jgi:3',5'-cyclic AMP phosphodiesterase CpdA